MSIYSLSILFYSIGRHYEFGFGQARFPEVIAITCKDLKRLFRGWYVHVPKYMHVPVESECSMCKYVQLIFARLE